MGLLTQLKSRTIVLGILVGSYMIFSFLTPFIGRSIRKKDTVSVQLIHSNTSIVFYTIAGVKQQLKPDLRGKFWEFQLKSFTGKYWLEYLSDGPLYVNGINYTILPHQNMTYDDKKFCIRTPESWIHFAKYHSEARWYLRGTHDTFINISGLSELISELETKIDPMKEFGFAFNFHEYGNIFYPQGGTGWLFSNYAVMRFAKEHKKFREICEMCYDDVAVPYFFHHFGLNINNWQTNRFIVTFPNTEIQIIKRQEWGKVPICPKNGYKLSPSLPPLYPGFVRKAVCIHMHKVDMSESWNLMKMIPDNIGVTFLNPNKPTFCRHETNISLT